MININLIKNLILKLKIKLGTKKSSQAFGAYNDSKIDVEGCSVDGFDKVAESKNNSKISIKNTKIRKNQVG